MKKIHINTPYITLGQLLKFSSLVSSGGETKMFLEMHTIYVNDTLENRRGKKCFPGDVVKIVDVDEIEIEGQIL